MASLAPSTCSFGAPLCCWPSGPSAIPPPRPFSRLRASGLSRASPARGAAPCSTSSTRRRSSPTRGAAP
eukprot:6196595-Alexandrium_andersonii.AAC.1